MFECVNADADAEVKDAPGSVRVTTLSPGSARVRSPAKCQLSNFPLKMLLHSDIRINIRILHVGTSARPHIRIPSQLPFSLCKNMNNGCRTVFR